jgi:hypothetical protein
MSRRPLSRLRESGLGRWSFFTIWLVIIGIIKLFFDILTRLVELAKEIRGQ